MVPRARTAGSPTWLADSVRAAGRPLAAATCAYVQHAPIMPPVMARRSAMRPMSISADTSVWRSFSSGMMLWPPASSLAPGCCLSSLAASRTDSAR
ncbi:MAG: hypothetical protein DWI67_04025 [Chloroflexi bacterium]|nr:MAG: hypothetical protein DWI67_04025 [Chloroflexota bacterium]